MQNETNYRKEGNLSCRVQLTNSCRSCFVDRGSHQRTGIVVVLDNHLGTAAVVADTADKLPCFEHRDKRCRVVVAERLLDRPEEFKCFVKIHFTILKTLIYLRSSNLLFNRFSFFDLSK